MEERQGYTGEMITISIVRASLYALVVLIVAAAVLGVPYFFVWVYNPQSSGSITFDSSPIVSILLFFLLYLLGIVLHELLHGLTWAMFTKSGFKSIKFGILVKFLTPYCHCREPLSKSSYILGALVPTIVLGIVPAIITLVIGNLMILILALLLIAGGTGDLMVILALRGKSKDCLVQDHPSEAGFYLYTPVKGEQES